MHRHVVPLATVVVVAAMMVARVVQSSITEGAPRIIMASQIGEIAYKQNEEVKLECHAEGSPAPVYSWKKNGILLAVPGGRYEIPPGAGTLVIKQTTSADDGHYNCLATNSFGTSVGMIQRLQEAVIKPFDTRNPTVVTPGVGEALRIPCIPPEVYPKSSTYFAYNQPGTSRMVHIVNDNRVVLDYDGNLHFANVLMNDSLTTIGANIHYSCVVYNNVLGAYVQGNDYRVAPQQRPGAATYHAPQLSWPGYSHSVAIRGQTKKLKCIFSGLPTPTVTWHGVDSNGNVNSRFKVTEAGFGTEIEITNVDIGDEGFYTCTANNSATGRPASHRIQVSVQSAPWWANTPLEKHVDEESDVEIDCTVRGTPNPNITWFINGDQATERNFTDQKSLRGPILSYRNVTVRDSQVVQCMSSNEHGTIMTNIILKVNAEQPSFMETPKDRKVVKGTSVAFDCNTRGAPKPTIAWFRGKPPREVHGGQFTVTNSGRNLEIKNTELDDTDTYRCVATNKYGKNEALVELTVRGPTSIVHDSVNREVNVSSGVIIPCAVTTDPSELSNLVVEWLMDGIRIDFKTETHMYVDRTDHSLRIRSSKVKDTGSYSCNATNGLDSTQSGVSTLKVKDRPDPPYNVTIVRCESTSVEIAWLAGSSNNDPITEFTVHYTGSFSSGGNVTHDRANGADFAQAARNQKRVTVDPGSRYSFDVSATNGLGTSDGSGQSGLTCDTPSVAPYRNPGGVCGALSSALQLNITWNPMPKEEHNGEGFHYVVSYKKHRTSDAEKSKDVDDPKQSFIAIHGQNEPFALFEVSVRAANRMGVAPLGQYDRKLVRSGEGKPQVIPLNFELVNGTLNGSYAEFTWDKVDTSLETVRGFFRGYRVVFWKTAEPNTRRHEDILIDQPFSLCRDLAEGPVNIDPTRFRRHHHNQHRRQRHHRHARSTDRVSGATNMLWPKSQISAAVQVLNQANAGADSNVIEFQTPVGVPGRVSNLRVIERGWSHLIVEWELDAQYVDDIVGYNLEYSVAPPAVGDSIPISVNNPKLRSYKIRRLDYFTWYRISVTAVTSAGAGGDEVVNGQTLPILNGPDAPRIVNITTQDGSANVSWLHSDQHIPINPGSDFFVSYRGPADNKTAVRTVESDPSSDENWANITGLERGKYEIWVVARSGFGDNARDNKSQSWAVHIGQKDNIVIPPEPEKEPFVLHEASAGWFIILMCIIALLLMVLLIVCILNRTRGDMYPVYEKEKMWRHQPLAPDETPFGEYTPSSENPNVNRSQGSLDSDEKPMESDSDSLGEYEDQDASKFNEDGSFIGQYTGRHKSDSMRPAAINTSV